MLLLQNIITKPSVYVIHTQCVFGHSSEAPRIAPRIELRPRSLPPTCEVIDWGAGQSTLCHVSELYPPSMLLLADGEHFSSLQFYKRPSHSASDVPRHLRPTMSRPMSMPDFSALLDASTPLQSRREQPRKKPSISLAAGLIMATTESPRTQPNTPLPPLSKIAPDWSDNLFYAYAQKVYGTVACPSPFPSWARLHTRSGC